MDTFEQAIKSWTDIALASLQKTLDDEGVKIVELQTKSVEDRKDLASKTKQFRKLPDNEKLPEIKPLLKLYQNEIDSLTNRAKFSETCFMNVYKVLAEAPDPKPLLEAAVESVIAAADVTRLTQENARLNDIISKHADYDTIKAKLTNLEKSSVETTEAQVKAKEAELTALMDEKQRNWDLREEELTKQLKELRENHEAAEAQLSKTTAAVDGSVGSADTAADGNRIAELEFIAGDLERANRKVMNFEKRNLELRKELESLKSGAQEQTYKQEAEKTIQELEGTLSTTSARLESLRTKLAQTKSEATRRIEQLERELQRKSSEVDSLRDKLNRQSDYEEVKRELAVIQSVFNDTGDVDLEDGDTSAAAAQASAQDSLDQSEASQFDRLLLAKNKQLNNDLTHLRVKNGELTVKLEKAEHEVQELEGELENMRELNNKLEEDLSNIKQSSGAGTMSMVSGWNNSGRISPTTSILGGREPMRGGASTAASVAGQQGQGADILPIITQQRDRFRARNNELEQELRKNWSVITSLRKELETVKKDNLDLYERSRYVESYKRSLPRFGGGGANKGVDDKYRSMYEESISPFAIFKGTESQQALSRLNPFEKITYSFTKIILSNRFSRNLFMVYCIALHLLVMFCISYGLGSSQPVHMEVVEAPLEVLTDSLGAADIAGGSVGGMAGGMVDNLGGPGGPI